MGSPQPVREHPAPNRRRQLTVGAVVVVVVTIAMAFAAILYLQNRDAARAYDTALASHETSRELQAGVGLKLEKAVERGATSQTVAADVVAVAEDGLVGAVEKAELKKRSEALTSFLTLAGPLLREPSVVVAVADGRPGTVAELRAAASGLAIDAARITTDAERKRALSEKIDAATAGISEAGSALIATIPAAVDSLAEANRSATNDAQIDLRENAATTMGMLASWDATLPLALTNLVASARAVQESHAAREALKAGPFSAQKAAAEEFARSISGGVVLEFTWSPVLHLNGADRGNNGSVAGLATFGKVGGTSYSEISLTDSVAEQWDLGSSSRALIAHEVGHGLVSKCIPLFSEHFGTEIEVWATAWAIGMGFDEPYSGESSYGRPSDELIAISAQCR